VSSRRERGYAMIAAVAAVAVFGYLSLAAISGGRSAVIAAGAGLARARLTADADAGVALAVHDLGLVDPKRRWRLTDPPRQVEFQGAHLTISIADENGKIPLNFVQRSELRRLFELGGADPSKIDALVDAFVDLRGDPRPGGARLAAGFPRVDARIAAQRGPLSSVEELQLLPDMTPAVYARIAPAVTVHAVTLAFDPRTASPLALDVMSPSASGAGAGPTLSNEALALAGHTVSVRVDAMDGHGGGLRRTAVVEFTGSPARPYVMRGLE
jgi:general secretion pathway protein K